ncbi:MAG: DUF1926 domain-containing protein [Vampirovibrio sp.]|nr:DUF1926 domain-containing protein [Vampirovibrio sp.]
MINLLFGIHNHQPVDNWDSVMSHATEKCYQPFLDVLEAHPKIHAGIHFTGYLLDWLADNHPSTIEQVQRMALSGQLEVLTGGYYEPILAMIPDEDKVGQIQALTHRIHQLIGILPTGMWQAERVWEPHLPKYLAKAGVKYVFLDDVHFNHAGFPDDALLGLYTTEEQGHTLDVLPIRKSLRYKIPFAQPQEIVEELLGLAHHHDGGAAIYFDDGEKFGVWPGTHQWVYKEKWLDKFFNAVEHHPNAIQAVTPSEYIANSKSLGRAYLPSASYSEMLAWALPSEKHSAYEAAVKQASSEQQPFIKAGFWRHFLIKYPEANMLHKKMQRVANKVRQMNSKSAYLAQATQALWKGQSNDVFWHGTFGGLYLTNLRSANYRHLLHAENLADDSNRGKQFFNLEEADIDGDGLPEMIIETHQQNLYLDTDQGGALVEVDYRPSCINLLDTLARRYEPYHDEFDADRKSKIHYDWHRRASLLDHFWAPDTNLDSVSQSTFGEVGNFILEPYQAEKTGSHSITLTRDGAVWDNGVQQPIQVTKTLTVDPKEAATRIKYSIINLSNTPLPLWFAPEFNINLLAPDAPDRYYYTPVTHTPSEAGVVQQETTAVAVAVTERQKLTHPKLQSRGKLSQQTAIGLVDEWQQVDYQLHFSKPTDIWRFPIETTSKSESGIDRVYQSSAIFPNWKFQLEPGTSWDVEILQVLSKP